MPRRSVEKAVYSIVQQFLSDTQSTEYSEEIIFDPSTTKAVRDEDMDVVAEMIVNHPGLRQDETIDVEVTRQHTSLIVLFRRTLAA